MGSNPALSKTRQWMIPETAAPLEPSVRDALISENNAGLDLELPQGHPGKHDVLALDMLTSTARHWRITTPGTIDRSY